MWFFNKIYQISCMLQSNHGKAAKSFHATFVCYVAIFCTCSRSFLVLGDMCPPDELLSFDWQKQSI